VHIADNLPPSSADVTESGSLNPLEPSGPHRAVMGLLYRNFFIARHLGMVREGGVANVSERHLLRSPTLSSTMTCLVPGEIERCIVTPLVGAGVDIIHIATA
jgi:hypothetical protein